MERMKRSPRLPRGKKAIEGIYQKQDSEMIRIRDVELDETSERDVQMRRDSLEVTLTVGQLIAIKRKERHWSQFDLATASGVSRTEIGRVERDECDPSVSTIEALEGALDLDLYDRFMDQRRAWAKRKQKYGKAKQPISKEIAKKLVQMGITGDDLDHVLDETKKTVDNLIQNKKTY